MNDVATAERLGVAGAISGHEPVEAPMAFRSNPMLDWLGWWTYLMIVGAPVRSAFDVPAAVRVRSV